jgi:transposase
MSGLIEGEDRTHATLFPERIDDYIAEDNAVRVIDVFVDELDLSGLGFKTIPEVTGRPAYHPAMMLKLYLYGYLNRIQSSRRLEREAGRNVELMWLLGRLAPDFKTIADFRKNTGEAIRLVCREFVVLCRKLNLFSDAFVAIDGSKFKAVNNRDRNLSKGKLKSRLRQIDESIARYLGEIASADRQDSEAATSKTIWLESKIAALKEEIQALKKLEVRMLAAPDQQISLTDPAARAMRTAGRGTDIVGYNVQTAVDTRHHLIVAHEVTNVGSDRAQLANMAKQAKEAIHCEDLSVLADRGYYSGEEILACDKAGITAYVPKTQTSTNQARGLFGKRDFIYRSEDDEYECPAGERLTYRTTMKSTGQLIRRYWFSGCAQCRLKSQCTTGKERRVSRREHEAVLEAMEDRVDRKRHCMRIRAGTVEHPFGTIKSWLGPTHFQMKTLKHVSTEMSLHVLAYNLKRMLQIVGPALLMEAMRA